MYFIEIYVVRKCELPIQYIRTSLSNHIEYNCNFVTLKLQMFLFLNVYTYLSFSTECSL